MFWVGLYAGRVSGPFEIETKMNTTQYAMISSKTRSGKKSGHRLLDISFCLCKMVLPAILLTITLAFSWINSKAELSQTRLRLSGQHDCNTLDFFFRDMLCNTYTGLISTLQYFLFFTFKSKQFKE